MKMKLFNLWLVASTMALSFSLGMFTVAGYKTKSIDKVPILRKLKERTPSDNPKYSAAVVLADKTGQKFCSGTVIDTGFIVTAAHCIDDKLGQSLKIFTSDGALTDAKAQAAATNGRMDYGIVAGDFMDFKVAKANLYGLNMEAKMYLSCGNPYGQKKYFCTPIMPFGNQYFSVKAVGMLFPGMSGGPVIDIQSQEVVGVNSAVDDGYVIVYPLTGLPAAFDIEEN